MDARHSFNNHTKTPQSVWRFVVVSIGIHVLIVWLVSLHHDSKPTLAPLPKTEPLKATLVNIDLTQWQIPEASTSVEAEKKEPPVAEIENNAALSVQAEQSEPETPKVEEQPSEKPSEETAAELQTTPSENPIPSTQQAITPSTKQTGDHSSSRNLARQHLEQYFRQQYQHDATQASKDFQVSKDSPTLPKQEYDTFTTEDEKLRKRVQTRVNCESGVNKTLASLSSFVGGTLRCTDPPDVDKFINQRVKKAPSDGQR